MRRNTQTAIFGTSGSGSCSNIFRAFLEVYCGGPEFRAWPWGYFFGGIPGPAIPGLSLLKLSGIASRDSPVIRIRIRIVRREQPAKRRKHEPCKIKARVFPPFLLVGR